MTIHANSMIVKRSVVASILCLASVISTACSGDAVTAIPSTPSPDKFWSVRNDIQATALAVGGQQRIIATPLDARGLPLPQSPKISFTSLNATAVSVDSTGLITGLATTTADAYVVARATVDGVTYADTTTVTVTATRQAIASIAIVTWFGSPISSYVDLNKSISYTVQVNDSAGGTVFGISPAVYALDPKIMTAGSTYATAQSLGTTKLVATVTAYGQSLTDTVDIVVQLPTNVMLDLFDAWIGNVVIAVNGTVTWTNYTFPERTINIIFDETSPHIVGGNIPSLTPYSSETRQFTAVGVYRYRDTSNGEMAAVIVREQQTH